jgi:hypothetical protein
LSIRHHGEGPSAPTSTGHDLSNTEESHANPAAIRPGIYQIRFSGGSAYNFGEGIGVLKDGAINGGDSGFVYHGSYRIEDSHVSAKISVKRLNPAVPNPIVNLPEYDLIVERCAHADGVRFLVEGYVRQQPNLRIQIEGKWLEAVV